jgi:tetratricopeptide (TPR) repeat protein
MGKTRLTSQFLRHFGPGDCSILYGRCQSHGQYTPYLPLMDMLNRWWGIDETDTAVVTATKAEAASRAPDGPPAGTGTRLLGLLGVPSAAAAELLAPRELRARTFAALHGLFIHHSEQKPLIIVIEDLHWIDATSEEYLTELSGRLATRRLLLLMTFRSGYRPPWQTQSIYTQLAIAPLLDEESRVLVRATRRGRPLSTPLEAQIVARSRGNPFFLEALTQAVTEQAAPASTLDVPDTIQSLLEAHIDRLSGPAKHLLQVAAVIGPDVPLRLLRGLAALPDGVIDDALQGLEVTELLYETRPAPDSIYGFQHGLVQDVAYQSLLRQTRRELHRRAVMLLEAQAAEAGDGHDVPQRAGGLERLAHHATQGELWESAVRYGQQAGMRAFARGSNAEAVAALEQAIAVSEHLPQDRATVERAIDLRLALRSALLPAGDFARTLACVREAEELAESLGDHQRVAQAAFFLSLHLYVRGQHAEAVRAGQRAQALTAGRDPIVHAIATYLVGIPLQALGLHSRATECFEQSLTALGGPRRLQFFNLAVLPSVTSCAFLATCNAELGRFEQARTRGAEGLEIAEAAAHPPSTMFAPWGAGWAAFRQADTPRALSLLVRALDICRDSGLVLHFPMVAVPLAGTYVLAGRAGDAVALLRHTIDQVVAHDMANFAGVCRFALAEALLETGGIDEAAACAGEALAVARRQEERGYEAYALRVLGDAARRRGDICASLERARESLAIAGALGMAPLEAHCHADIGAAYAAMGHPGQAREALERSIERYRAIAMRWHEQRALASLAQLP